MPGICYSCGERRETKRCSACQHAHYCSKTCQKRHWKKHKPNCIPPESSLHELFDACAMDLWPSAPAAHDYGFDNVKLYHGDSVFPRDSRGLTPEHVLLGLYQIITRDIKNDELPNVGEFLSDIPVYNSIGASKKMMLESFEKNSLDDFLHRYISSVIERVGDQLPPDCYIFQWTRHRLVIGPTRLLLSESVGLTQGQVVQMRNDIYRRYYETSS
ncbi:uncharacterized protein LOC110054792 [Orbicella faveolata]|uniref:uncharacterized protein LOC110054790 n=1 Tax=Orbicella faveolata TaxID=48498 RepID=UPI0009E47358|nr:uncharacterized protein LOC110054790 [Orbicella faveolata]XP_020616807.1 uncharacterized protein LOC110054791 [Orbicella faveolata]XP_020616809.1 uncharacterized protein LOC110054792 [Orbicella faveolata]